MNPDRLTAHFHRIAEAPGAVPQLRRFILDLAVRGKLVSQDPSDEPATELLKRITAEKARLVRAGQISRPKSTPSLAANDPPFSLPARWHWSQIAEIGLLNPRNSAPDDLSASFVPMTMVAAEYGIENQHEVRPWGEIKNGYTHFAEGDVGLAKITPCFENGKSTVFRNLTGGIGSGTTELHIVRPLFVDPKYVLIFLKCPHFIETGIPKMTGTAGQKRVPNEYFAHSPFPLPPLAAQHRTVAKVNELMALCDRLEAARADRDKRRERMAAASLARLNEPEHDATKFRDDADFAIHNLAGLTSHFEQISPLRQSILALAVRGKLVPQDPDDEPASELLVKRIGLPHGYERRRKIQKKHAAKMPADQFPPVPTSWLYADIQTLYERNAIVDYADGNHGSLYPRSNEFGPSGIDFVTARDITNGRVNWNSCAKLNAERAGQLKKGWANGEDVLLTHNATVGRVALVEPGVGRFLLGTSVTFYRLHSGVIDPQYFFVVLSSPLWQRQLERIMQQTTRNQVSIQKQAKLIVAIPPLPEQRRIVIRVADLMALCDRLETSLSARDYNRRRLLEAVLHEALTLSERTRSSEPALATALG